MWSTSLSSDSTQRFLATWFGTIPGSRVSHKKEKTLKTKKKDMGFNKRYVSGKGIAAAFTNGGVLSVIDYFAKPDALITPASACWARDVHNKFDEAFWNDTPTEENADLIKVLEEGIEEMYILERTILTLQDQLKNETDPELNAYMQATIQNNDKKLKYYYV